MAVVTRVIHADGKHKQMPMPLAVFEASQDPCSQHNKKNKCNKSYSGHILLLFVTFLVLYFSTVVT
jgi:hypothetical protein